MAEFELARFSADVTIPLGHRCMGILPTKAKEIVDPLEAHGFVLLGAGKPLVFVAVDWCEIRNLAYERWREVLAEAAGTTPQRVLVTSLHQHDAPVTDLGAENWLARVGMSGELNDHAFHEATVQRVAAALKESLQDRVPVTHIGVGKAKVKKVASNRRVVTEDGRVNFSRGSRSGGSPFHRDADVGEIDPWLRTLSFWNGDQAVLALHTYATHPMSYYGRGGVSADFVGTARRLRFRDDQRVAQIYASGCSGDVTAGKFNDGSPANRQLLAHRLHAAMQAAWEATERHPLEKADFRCSQVDFEFRKGPAFEIPALVAKLENEKLDERYRILAAMALASRQRVQAGHAIDVPCIDFGPAQVVIQPGEAFVSFQLQAQAMRPDSEVLSVGYGECWPGYIPTEAAFADGFTDTWLWVPPGSEPRLIAALKKSLVAG